MPCAGRSSALSLPARHVLVDGRDVPPLPLGITGEAIDGDQRSQSIAAASIVAKVMRDRMMARAEDTYPGFEVHMGYATARHRTAIEAHGPVARLHRVSFAPFRLGGAEVVEEEGLAGLD